MKTYKFETADGYTVEVDVFGEYRDSYCKDIAVAYANDTEHGHDGNSAEFTETDSAADAMDWLVGEGLKFEGLRSMRFNYSAIQSVLIDGDMTLEGMLDEAARWTDADLAEWAEWVGGDWLKAIEGVE